MRDRTVSKVLVLLLALCCLVPMVALAAILFLQASIAPTALVALFVLVLLARRLPGSSRPLGMTAVAREYFSLKYPRSVLDTAIVLSG